MLEPKATVEQRHADAIDRLRGDNKDVAIPDFPLYREPDHPLSSDANPKNVVLIVMESVRASETGVYANKPYTPNLDRIAKEAIVVSDFYANSIQTVRGEMSLLCGVLDLFRGAPLSSHGYPVRNECLPEILSDRGYETLWFHGYEKSFFKRDHFLPSVGFSQIHDRDVMRKSGAVSKEIGWGIVDEEVFEYALNTLEKSEQPFFAEILTLSNHYPFSWEWSEIDWPYADQVDDNASLMERYRVGIRYTDYALGKFWDAFSASELKHNTAVVIVSDHGIWAFDEAESDSPMVRHEKYFRMPLLMVLPDRPPQNITAIASQVDLPPTLLSYLKISVPTAFLGENIFSNKKEPEGGFAIMLKNGSYGFRSADVHCYPTGVVCGEEEDEGYQQCRTDLSATSVECVDSQGLDLLNLSDTRELPRISRDLRFVDDIIEYMSVGHIEGFFPDHTQVKQLHSRSAAVVPGA